MKHRSSKLAGSGLTPGLSLPDPSDIRKFFDTAKSIENAADYYMWRERSGHVRSSWDETPPEFLKSAQTHVDSIVTSFEADLANGGEGYKISVGTVTLQDEEVDIWSNIRPMKVEVEGNILNPKGDSIGHWSRIVYFPKDAPPFAEYHSLDIYAKYQGKGLGRGAIKHFDGVMKRWGVENVEVLANLDIGGYAWARSGYDWDRTVGSRHEDNPKGCQLK